MDVFTQRVIAFLCVVGGCYAIWLIYDCVKKGAREKRQANGFRKKGHYSTEINWLLEIAGSATLLVVTGAFLVSCTRDSSPQSTGSGADCYLQISGNRTLPSRAFRFQGNNIGNTINAVDLACLPITDEDVRIIIEHAPDMLFINLAATNITDDCLDELRYASQLKSLVVGRTGITDSSLRYIARLKGLEYLSLDSTQITDAGLAYVRDMTDLTDLDLRRTCVTDKGLKSLRELPHLEHLEVYGTAVTQDGVRELMTHLPDLQCDIVF